MSRKWKTVILFLIIAGLFGVGIYIGGNNAKNNTPPNEKLIEYLEIQRLHYDSVAMVQQSKMDIFILAAEAREKKDSQIFVTTQNRLLQSIQTIKAQYEKIPSYSNLSNDSLRRIFAARFKD